MPISSLWIVDVKTDTFEQEILQRSMDTLVVLDFWAPWCGPCRQLSPVLEKLAVEYNGRFILAKVNTEEELQLAAAFRVQSIPWVLAMQGGRPVDQFMGLLPEAEIRAWLDRLLPSPAELLAAEADALVDTEPQAAENKYREALTLDDNNPAVMAKLARLLLTRSRFEECQRLIDTLASRGFLEPEAQRVQSELELRLSAAETGGVAAARQALEADPKNATLQIQLAEALAAGQQHGKALELCLEVVREHRSAEIGLQAKQVMVQMFDMLGPSSELTGEYRRKLATALY